MFSELQDLKQGNKWLNIPEKFFLVHARCDMDESEDVASHRSCHVLRLDIWHLLAFQNFAIVDEVVKYAVKAQEVVSH